MERLTDKLNNFKNGLASGADIFELQTAWSNAIDNKIKFLFEPFAENRMAIFATGGFGRAQMSPYSDIDLLFLFDGDIGKIKPLIDAILYPLWNEGMEAGGATRTLNDCSKMFFGDIRTQNAMCESRFIAGNEQLASAFNNILGKVLSDKNWQMQFVKAKYNEHLQRQKKFGGSVYLLEPHIKEGEGGLRDWHTACAIARAAGKNNLPNISNELKFLSTIRAHLHLNAQKRDDRLTFANQKILSQKLNQNVEDIMSHFYMSAATIHNKTTPVIQMTAPMGQRLKIWWHKGKVKRLVGSQPSWQRLCSNMDVIYSALKLMHQSGRLKKMIPSFSNIYFRAQYDAYHIYTVDVHSLFAIQRLTELEQGSGPNLVKRIYKKIKRKDLLYLATLLHDIGKTGNTDGGTKKEHAIRGAKIAAEEAINQGLGNADAQKISFLVGSHLIMPRLAFSRDITDPHLIENFANSIRQKENLDMLFVMAYADIASIGPDVWTVWKEKLLDELYITTNGFFLGHKIDSIKKAVERRNKKLYAELYKEFFNEPKKSIVTKCSAYSTYSEIVIMTKDAPGVFSSVAWVLAKSRINILEANLNSNSDGIVLDVLRVTSENGGPITDTTYKRAVLDLEDIFSAKQKIGELEKSFLRPGPEMNPRVEVDNDVSMYYTVIDVHAKDRVGLLFDVTDALFKAGCDIALAKILTRADIVQDAFYVRDFSGQKITAKEKLKEIQSALLNRLART